MKKLIVKYLKRTYKLEDVIYTQCANNDNQKVELPTIGARFTVMAGKTWKDVKVYIDNIIDNLCNKDKQSECPICFEMVSNMSFTGCPECYHMYCYVCMG